VESRMLTSRDSAKREPPAPDLLDSKHRDDMTVAGRFSPQAGLACRPEGSERY
jgi:hypothetical protein